MQKFSANTPYWLAAFAIALLYTAIYAAMIHRDNAIPYWDQAGYIQKVYSLVDKWNTPGLSKFNPAHYLNAPPAMRGPLMAIAPALLFGQSATPHQIAYTWLIERTLFLMLALYIWTKIIGHARWIIPALALILASHWFLSLNQNLYLMDLPCASMALLFTGLAGLSIQHRQLRYAALTCIAALALILLKPQSAAWVAIVSAFLITKRFFHDRNFLRTAKWITPFIILACTILYLFFSPYVRAVRAEYLIGLRGYWRQNLDYRMTIEILTGILPGWLLLAVAILLFSKKRIQKGALSGLFWMWFGAILGWLLFSFFAVYTIDPRIIWMVAPIAICGTTAFLCHTPWMRLTVHITASLLFITSLSIALYAFPTKSLDLYGLTGPRIVYQPPIPEAGLQNLVKNIATTVGDDHIQVLVNEEFIDYSALNLVARSQKIPTKFLPNPVGNTGLKIQEIFTPQTPWFITRPGPISWNLKETIVANMRQASRLITDQNSPIHNLFEQAGSWKIQNPAIGEFGILPIPNEGETRSDNVTLWHLKRAITPDEANACITYLKQFAASHGTDPHAIPKGG